MEKDTRIIKLVSPQFLQNLCFLMLGERGKSFDAAEIVKNLLAYADVLLVFILVVVVSQFGAEFIRLFTVWLGLRVN